MKELVAKDFFYYNFTFRFARHSGKKLHSTLQNFAAGQRVSMRTNNNLWAAAVMLACAGVCACSKNNTSQTIDEKEPPPPAPQAEAPAPSASPIPAGPIAGSVLDVVSPDSPMPPDVLIAMAAYGVKTQGQTKFWHTQSLDINEDGSKELLISNVVEWCGSGGCSLWLWQRTRNGLRNLLPTEDITAAAINLEDARTESYRNLSVFHRATGKNKEFLMVSDLYVWNGEAYRKSSTIEHGKYLDTPLPATVWKVLP